MAGLANMELVKNGWLEKYSVGRGIIPLKNWQRRWFTIDHNGLNYSKSPSDAPARRTYIPFIAGPAAATGDVQLAPVFLYASVTPAIHPEASDPSQFYFALRFLERGTPRLLLLRTPDVKERDAWVRFMSLFVHAAALSGSQYSTSNSKRGIDPDELDPREKVVLKQAIMNWDEGCHFRATGDGAPMKAPENFDDCTVWHSDDEISGQASRRGSKSNGQTPTSQSPRGPRAPNSPSHRAAAPAADYDCL